MKIKRMERLQEETLQVTLTRNQGQALLEAADEALYRPSALHTVRGAEVIEHTKSGRLVLQEALAQQFREALDEDES